MANTKKIFVLALLSFCIGVGCSPIMHQVHRNGVKGVIIDRKVRFIYMFEYINEMRFNPTRSEIDKFERYMATDKNLDTLKSHTRQYAGYFDKNTRERCLFVILLGKWETEHSPWRKSPIVVFDGFLKGIEFNLSTQKLKVFDL